MPAAAILIQVYERKVAVPSQRWRWRAKATNVRKLANGGEGYRDLDGLVHALGLLWPPGADEHVMVQLPSKAPVALAALRAA